MTDVKNDIQTLLDDSISLSEIVESMKANENINKFVKSHGIHKTFSKYFSQLSFRLSNENDALNSDILCCGFGEKMFSIDKIMEILSNVPKICLENVYYIGFDIKDDTRTMSENDRSYLAQKFTYFAEFLYQKCPNASRLWLTNKYNFVGNDDFLIYIIERLKTDKVVEIKPIILEDLLSYSAKYDFVKRRFFSETPNLKIFAVEISTSDLPSHFTDSITPLQKLANCLCKIKNVTLELYVEGNHKSLYIASKILHYASAVNLKINIKQSSSWIEYFQDVNYKITNDFSNIIYNLTTVTLFVNILEDFKIIRKFMTLLENLKSITLHIDIDILNNVFKQYKNIEVCSLKIRQYFDFESSIKKLMEFRIHLLSLSNEKSLSDGNELFILNNVFLEEMFSIIPTTIKTLHLININGYKLKIFQQFPIKFPFLSTISFLLCINIPENAIYEIKSLRNVVIHGELKVNIPEFVETVIFCYFDEDFCDGIERKSQNKPNTYFFKLINTIFNNSIRNIKNDELYYIAFLKDILKWKDILYLADDCFY
uniref:BTB domain-containing protein n=1 Tax=Strongyloides venezuelensis TaxID=75913 RepID=A0A0K0F3M6_STRVS